LTSRAETSNYVDLLLYTRTLTFIFPIISNLDLHSKSGKRGSAAILDLANFDCLPELYVLLSRPAQSASIHNSTSNAIVGGAFAVCDFNMPARAPRPDEGPTGIESFIASK